MPGKSRSYALNISAELFKLSTESVRLHSNETLRYQTLAKLLAGRINKDTPLNTEDPGVWKEFLDAMPTRGDVRIHLNISVTNADSLVEIRDQLSQEIGNRLTLGDAISILLYDYLIENRATRVLSRLPLGEKSPKGGSQD